MGTLSVRPRRDANRYVAHHTEAVAMMLMTAKAGKMTGERSTTMIPMMT